MSQTQTVSHPAAKRLNGAAPRAEQIHAADTQTFSDFFAEVDHIIAVFENLSWKRALIASIAFVGGLAMGTYGVISVVNMLLAGAVVLSTPMWIAMCMAVLVAFIGAKIVVRFASKVAAKIIAGAYDEPVQSVTDRIKAVGTRLVPAKSAKAKH